MGELVVFVGLILIIVCLGMALNKIISDEYRKSREQEEKERQLKYFELKVLLDDPTREELMKIINDPKGKEFWDNIIKDIEEERVIKPFNYKQFNAWWRYQNDISFRKSVNEWGKYLDKTQRGLKW